MRRSQARCRHRVSQTSSYRFPTARLLLRLEPQPSQWRDPDAAGPQRLGQDHLPEAHQPAADAIVGRGVGGRQAVVRVGRHSAASPHRLRHPGRRPVSPLHRSAKRGAGSAGWRTGSRRGSAERVEEVLQLVGLPSGEFARALSRRTFRRTAAARGTGARAGRRAADPADG